MGLIVAIAVVLSINPVAFSASATTMVPSSWCKSQSLQLAPRLDEKPDLDPNGNPITITPGPAGLYVPIIMVHGWMGSDTHTVGRDGAFSKRIDLTVNQGGSVVSRASLIGQLQDMPGSAVFTFDYHKYSNRWVTDSNIGQALGDAIRCLYEASGQKVIVVAHSMGGLAVEEVFDPKLRGSADHVNEISSVITLGTPYKGSLVASLAQDTLTNAPSTAWLTLVRALLATCGRLNTINANNLCSSIKPLAPVTSIYSQAAIAMRYNSPQIRALPHIPSGIDVLQLGSEQTYDVPVSWFRASARTETVNLGDTIVSPDSSMPSGSSNGNPAQCHFTVNPVRAGKDGIGVKLGVVSKNDARHFNVPVIDATPCTHGQLPQDIELTNDVLDAVYRDINSRVVKAVNTVAQGVTAPAQCDQPSTKLVGGRISYGTDGYGETFLDYKGPFDDPGPLNYALADSRSRMSDKLNGAIAVGFFCTPTGVGGTWPEVIGVYDNSLNLLGRIDTADLLENSMDTTHSYVNKMQFEAGRLRVEWQYTPGGEFGTCQPVVQSLSYDLTSGPPYAHGPQTLVSGEPSCKPAPFGG